MTDLKFRCDGLFKEAFSGLNNQQTRVALIHYFGNSHTSKDAVDILIYLIAATYSADEVLLEKWDGFIVRTYEQIELDTGCKRLDKKTGDNNPLFVLENRELIERNNNSAYRTSRFRVNPDKISEEIERALEDFELRKEQISRKLEKKTENKIKFKENSKLNKDIDWDRMGEIASEAIRINTSPDVTEKEFEDYKASPDYKMIKEAGFTGRELMIIYTITSIYKEVFDKDYSWTYGEFNSLNNYFNHPQFFSGDFFKGTDAKRIKDGMELVKNEELDYLQKAHLSKKIIIGYEGVL